MSHKLLLADDSVTIQRVIELTFAGEDVQVLTAGDGEQAIARVQADRPDIVLADIGMPKRSGYDVAAFIKGQSELSHIPVLLLTGAFEPVDEGRAQAAGCDGVLVKPFEPQHVIARVRELLRDAAGREGRSAGTATRAVADVPRPAERLAPPRPVELPARRDPIGPAPLPGGGIGDFDFGLAPAADARAVAEPSLDEYFDQLDAAFANFGTGKQEPPAVQPEVLPRHERPVMEQDLDWFDSPPAAARSGQDSRPSHAGPIDPPAATFTMPPRPVVWPLPQPASMEPPDTTPEIAPQSAPPAAVMNAPAPDAGSAIAEAFAALLAAEQGEPDAAPVRLAIAAAPPAVTDDLIEEISRRVVERLGIPAVREVVVGVVSDVAERLVREEIARIRNQPAPHS